MTWNILAPLWLLHHAILMTLLVPWGGRGHQIELEIWFSALAWILNCAIFLSHLDFPQFSHLENRHNNSSLNDVNA